MGHYYHSNDTCTECSGYSAGFEEAMNSPVVVALVKGCKAFSAERADAMMSSGLQYALRKAENALRDYNKGVKE